jgi:DNA polymerase II small subunit/DNA polymerase delta subunit B
MAVGRGLITIKYERHSTKKKKKEKEKERKKEKKEREKKDYIIALLVWSGTNSSDIVVDCLMDTEFTTCRIVRMLSSLGKLRNQIVFRSA